MYLFFWRGGATSILEVLRPILKGYCMAALFVLLFFPMVLPSGWFERKTKGTPRHSRNYCYNTFLLLGGGGSHACLHVPLGGLQIPGLRAAGAIDLQKNHPCPIWFPFFGNPETAQPISHSLRTRIKVILYLRTTRLSSLVHRQDQECPTLINRTFHTESIF